MKIPRRLVPFWPLKYVTYRWCNKQSPKCEQFFESIDYLKTVVLCLYNKGSAFMDTVLIVNIKAIRAFDEE